MPTMRTGEVQKAMLSPRKTSTAEPGVQPASQAGWWPWWWWGDDGGHGGGDGDDGGGDGGHGGEKEKGEDEYGDVVIMMDAPRSGGKKTGNSFQKQLSFRYQKNKPNGQYRILNFGAGNGNWWQPFFMR